MSVPEIVNPETIEKDKESFGQKATELLLEANSFKVATQEEAAEATDFLKAVKTQFKALEEKRMEYVRPHIDGQKKINEDFKGMQKPFVLAEKVVKEKLSEYQKALEEEERKKIAKAEEEAEKKGTSKTVAAQEVKKTPSSVKTSKATTSFRTVTKFEVVDESKLPREYLSPDERKIKAAVSNGTREIAGVRIWDDKEVSVR